MKTSDRSGVTKIHNVGFYNLSPRSINCFAYNKNNGKFAVARNDACLEIWDVTHAFALEKTIPGSVDLSIDALGWAGDRLFSAGISSEIIEWDLNYLQKKYVHSVTGTFILCLDINLQEDCLVVGTDDGYLNLFEIVENGLTYKTLFDKQEGRIICCKFDPTGEFIVTGSIDVIRIWNSKTGHAIQKMTLGRTETKRETTVWSLQILKDFKIISGDSRGYVTVWDGKLGTEVQSIQVSKVDIFTIAMSEDEKTLVAAGVDALIRIFSLTTIKKEDQTLQKWVKYLQRHVHDHDVMAVVCAGTKIISGGVDGYLGISYYSKMSQGIDKYGPFLQPPCATLSSEKRLILLRYTNYLELWRLGVAENKLQINENENDTRKLLLLEEGPKKLLELRSYNDEFIVCSAISSDGSILAYSTQNSIRVFSLNKEENNEDFKLARIKVLPEKFSPSLRIIFSQDSKTIFLVKANRHVNVFSVMSNGEIDYLTTMDLSKYIKDVIHLVTVSASGNYFVAAGTCRSISIWKKSKKEWKHFTELPKYLVPTTAIAMHQNKPSLVAAFSDGKIFEYDLEELKFTCSSKQLFIPKMNMNCVNGILLDPRNEDVFILHNDTHLFTLQKCEDVKRNKKSLKLDETRTNVAKLELRFKKLYNHLIHLEWLTEEEIVVVSVNPVVLIEQLPAVFRQKKFGAT